MNYCCELMQRLGVSPEAALEISMRATTRSFDAGNVIVGPGMRSEHWKVIISGAVATTRALDSRAVPLMLHLPGAWIDEEVLLPGQAVHSEHVALSDVDLMLIPAAEVLRVASIHPSFSTYIIGEIARKSRRLCEAVLIQKMSSPLLRILATLANIAEGAVRTSPDGEGLGLDLSQAALANLCGVSRTVLSHQLLLLKAAGMVRLRYKSIQLCELDQWLRFLEWMRSGEATSWIQSIHDFLDVARSPYQMAEAA